MSKLLIFLFLFQSSIVWAGSNPFLDLIHKHQQHQNQTQQEPTQVQQESEDKQRLKFYLDMYQGDWILVLNEKFNPTVDIGLNGTKECSSEKYCCTSLHVKVGSSVVQGKFCLENRNEIDIQYQGKVIAQCYSTAIKIHLPKDSTVSKLPVDQIYSDPFLVDCGKFYLLRQW